MIWVLGGTSDAYEFSNYLGDTSHIVSLGTKEGMDYYNKENFIYKRMDQAQMEDFIKEYNIDLLVDLTHPFALEVSKNAKAAALSTSVPYERYERPALDYPETARVFSSYDQAFLYLKDYKGDLFVTTGVNMAHKFRQIQGENRYIYRVLPMVESVQKLHDIGINLKDIVAMVGPFSKELNIQLIKDYKLDGLIMKDSGDRGGSTEKIQACQETGIDLFIIQRSQTDIKQDVDQFYQVIEEKYLNKY